MLAIQPNGPIKITSGGSRIKEQRPLLNRDGEFFDEQREAYFTLGEIIATFIDSAHTVVAEIETNST